MKRNSMHSVCITTVNKIPPQAQPTSKILKLLKHVWVSKYKKIEIFTSKYTEVFAKLPFSVNTRTYLSIVFQKLIYIVNNCISFLCPVHIWYVFSITSSKQSPNRNDNLFELSVNFTLEELQPLIQFKINEHYYSWHPSFCDCLVSTRFEIF